MLQTGTYNRFFAWALVLLFTAFWSLKTVHVLVLHHHTEAEHPVCEATHDANIAHIHDESWAKEDCSLCAFVVSVSEPFALPQLSILFAKIPDSALSVFYQTPVLVKKVTDGMMRRGPPALKPA